MGTATASKVENLGPIEAGVIYPLLDFQRRVGWSRHAMRSARRAGLTVTYRHGRAFVTGDAFLRYMTDETTS